MVVAAVAEAATGAAAAASDEAVREDIRLVAATAAVATVEGAGEDAGTGHTERVLVDEEKEVFGRTAPDRDGNREIAPRWESDTCSGFAKGLVVKGEDCTNAYQRVESGVMNLRPDDFKALVEDQTCVKS